MNYRAEFSFREYLVIAIYKRRPHQGGNLKADMVREVAWISSTNAEKGSGVKNSEIFADILDARSQLGTGPHRAAEGMNFTKRPSFH